HGERRRPPAVRPLRAAVEVEAAGAVAEPERTDLLGDVDGVDVVATGGLDPRDDLEVVGRRELDVDAAPRIIGIREARHQQHRNSCAHRRSTIASTPRTALSY